MAEIRFAADNRRKVSLQYSDAKGVSSERIIWPLGMFFWGSVWTIGAWCELRGDFTGHKDKQTPTKPTANIA